MHTGMPNGNSSSIVAACILSAGLIAAAVIDTHHAPLAVASPSAPCVAARPMPPISEESVKAQVRAQILAAPALHTYVYGHTTYTLQDVNVTQVDYDQKEDFFNPKYNYVWQPAMPPDGPQSASAVLNNNGYGHYYGTADVAVVKNDMMTNDQHADIAIK